MQYYKSQGLNTSILLLLLFLFMSIQSNWIWYLRRILSNFIVAKYELIEIRFFLQDFEKMSCTFDQ